MNNLKIPCLISNFLYNLFSFKIMHFFHNNSSKTIRYSFFGLPQGSCLSPFLYNLFTSDMASIIPNGCYLLQFADDNVLSIRGKNRDVIEHFMQCALDNLDMWAHENGFSFSVQKTKFILFSRKHSPISINLFLNGLQIEQIDEYKYLGIWFDSKLNWNTHIIHIQKVCSRRINFLRTITGTWWGANPSDLITLYKTTIRSVMEYGCFTFGSAAQIHFSKLERIQYRCLRICLKLMNSTHTQSIEVLAGIVPLKIRFQELNCKFLINCFANNHQIISTLESLYQINPSNRIFDSFTHCKNQNLLHVHLNNVYDFKLNIHTYEPLIDLSLFYELRQIPKLLHSHFANFLFQRKFEGFNPTQMYFTDGSLIDGIAGFGVYNLCLTHFHKLQSPCSIFISELIALYFTCTMIRDCPPNLYIILAWFKKSFLLHTAYSIPNQIICLLTKFELIWLKTETAQARQSLYGNYYGKTMFFIQSTVVFPQVP
ncbi:uncharacterized protein LOC134287690 [Aedes albopictus]|uniref:Reverse transcriptase domain-containing protein n=1 Tax=Aedes albopictus TaxID=7160 RepID=A0ABM1YH20_AEDAL